MSGNMNKPSIKNFVGCTLALIFENDQQEGRPRTYSYPVPAGFCCTQQILKILNNKKKMADHNNKLQLRTVRHLWGVDEAWETVIPKMKKNGSRITNLFQIE